MCTEFNPLNAELNSICNLLALLGTHLIFHVSRVNSTNELVYVPPLPSPPSSINLQRLNLKSDADRRKAFKYWRALFIDVNHLPAAEYFFANRGDVVRCAFSRVEFGHWVKGYDAFKDHQRWSPSCEFVNGLYVENIPPSSETSQPQPSSSYYVCAPCMEYILKTSRPERCKYIFTFIYLFPPMCNYNTTAIFIVFCSYKI